MSNGVEKKVQTKERPYECVTVKPDGKLAWLIVVASFVINMIIDGFLYSFGAFSQNLKTHFDAQEWAISLIISIACGFYLLSAPVASKLCDKYGCGPVGILGSILASSAIAISIFSPNIYCMWILFGVFGGIGMGLLYLPSILIVGYCFEKKRAIATGIVTAGTGIGSITFGPFSSFLFTTYGWKIGLIILASMMLICTIASSIMVPVKSVLQNDETASPDSVEVAVRTPLVNGTTPIENADVDTSTVLPKSVSKSHDNLTEHRHSRTSLASSKASVSKIVSVGTSVHSLINHDTIVANTAPVILRSVSRTNLVHDQHTQTDPVKFAGEKKSFGQICGSLCGFGNDQKQNAQSRSILFVYMGNICSMIGYYTPYLFIVNYAVTERNIAREQAVFLLSVIGFSNTIARFGSGWIAKLPKMNALRVNNIGLVVAGISTILVAFSWTHLHLIVYCIIWGGFIALHVSMSPVIVCEIVGLEKFGKILGMTLMFRGITSFLAPPAMGGIRDVTSSFKIAFIIGGISFLASAACHLAVRIKNEDDESDEFDDMNEIVQQNSPIPVTKEKGNVVDA